MISQMILYITHQVNDRIAKKKEINKDRLVNKCTRILNQRWSSEKKYFSLTIKNNSKQSKRLIIQIKIKNCLQFYSRLNNKWTISVTFFFKSSKDSKIRITNKKKYNFAEQDSFIGMAISTYTDCSLLLISSLRCVNSIQGYGTTIKWLLYAYTETDKFLNSFNIT